MSFELTALFPRPSASQTVFPARPSIIDGDRQFFPPED